MTIEKVLQDFSEVERDKSKSKKFVPDSHLEWVRQNESLLKDNKVKIAINEPKFLSLNKNGIILCYEQSDEYVLQLSQNYVLIKRQEKIKESASGFIIPEHVAKKLNTGWVIGAGPGINRNTEYKKGDYVIFSQSAGVEITINGEELVIMRDLDLYGILHKEGDIDDSKIVNQTYKHLK